MTLREVVNDVGIDEDPFACAFLIAGFLRSVVQGEPSTFEGECASLNKLHELTGWWADSPDDIRKWLADLGAIPDIDVPDAFWDAMAAAGEADEQNENQS